MLPNQLCQDPSAPIPFRNIIGVSVGYWLQLTQFFIPNYIRPEFKFPVQHLTLIFLPF